MPHTGTMVMHSVRERQTFAIMRSRDQLLARHYCKVTPGQVIHSFTHMCLCHQAV